MCISDLHYCDCGWKERVAELAELRADAKAADEEHAKLVKLADQYRKLRAASDKARSILDLGWVFFNDMQLRDDAVARLEEFPKEQP
jgi:sugar phosphate isomerase/epimerase